MTAKSFALLLTLAAISSAQTGVRILLGMNDKQSTKWDGSVRARGTEVRSIEPWRFDTGDSIQGTSWKLSTHPVRLFNAGSQIGLAGVPIVPNGVVVRISNGAPDAQLDVQTAQGNFTIRLGDIGYGKV